LELHKLQLEISKQIHKE